MTYLNYTLRQTDWDLFDSMSAALEDMTRDRSIEYRPLRGWPFAWLLHPGFNDGLTVGDAASIFRLREIGLITVFRTANARYKDRITLTSRGRDLVEHRRQLPVSQSEHEYTGKRSLPGRNSDQE